MSLFARSYTTKKEIGNYGERIAARYLQLRGYCIRARNYRTGALELDLVATRGKSILFVEVKTRSYTAEELDTAPPPGTAVDFEKQKYTRRAATVYLREHPTARHPRMDVMEVWLEKRTDGRRPRTLRIRHLKGAY